MIFVILRKIYRSVAEMRWRGLLLMWFLHFVSCWAVLIATGEDILSAPDIFVYFYMTTATTVGYGDFSPQSHWGRLVTVFWIQPGAIAIFTAVITKIITELAEKWRRRLDGFGNYADEELATVIIGYPDHDGPVIIDEIVAGRREERSIIILDKKALPFFHDQVKFVKCEQFITESDLKRAGVEGAARVLIYGESDSETIATALAVRAINPEVHLVARFSSEQSGSLLKKHTDAECVYATDTSLLVRALQDPGSSMVLSALASTIDHATIYSLRVPEQTRVCIDALFIHLKQTHDAVLIAIRLPHEERPLFIQHAKGMVQDGSLLYFICEKRLNSHDIHWQALMNTD